MFNVQGELISFWKLYNETLIESKLCGFKTSNILGEYTEMLCCSVLGLTNVETSNNNGFDATDKEGKKVQIKGRRISSGNIAKLTTLWNLNFDYIIAVIFHGDGSIRFSQKISLEAIERDIPFVTKKSCWRVIANSIKSGTDGYEDITELFVDYERGLQKTLNS